MKSVRPHFQNNHRPSKVSNPSPKNKAKVPEIHPYKSKSPFQEHHDDEYLPNQNSENRENYHIHSVAHNDDSAMDLYNINESENIGERQTQPQFRDPMSDFNKKKQSFPSQVLDINELNQRRIQKESKKKLREMQKQLERLIKKKQIREKRLQKQLQRKELEKVKRSQMRQTFSEVHHLIYDQNSYPARNNSPEAAKQKGNKAAKKIKCIRFIKCEQLPLKFPNKEELAKYSKKLVIAKVLSQKGYSMRSITEYVMSMNSPFIKQISRTEMKTLSFTVISTTVRKLQKFIRVFAKKQVLEPNKEKRGHGSKSFLKKETIKNKSHFLMNFIHKFQIAHKMTFLKFLALEFRMRDVDITLQEAIDLIVYLRRNMEDKDFSHDKLVDIKNSFQQEEHNVDDEESVKSNQAQSQVSSRQSEKINQLSKLIEREQQIQQYKIDKTQEQKRFRQAHNKNLPKFNQINTNIQQGDENIFNGGQQQEISEMNVQQKETFHQYEDEINNEKQNQQNERNLDRANYFSQFNYDDHQNRKIYDQLMSEMEEFQDEDQSFIDVLKEVTNDSFNQNNAHYIYNQLQNGQQQQMENQNDHCPQDMMMPDDYHMNQEPYQHQIQNIHRQGVISKKSQSQDEWKNPNRNRDFDERLSHKSSIKKSDQFRVGSNCQVLKQQAENVFEIRSHHEENIDYRQSIQHRTQDLMGRQTEQRCQKQRKKKKKSVCSSRKDPCQKTTQTKQSSKKSKPLSKKMQINKGQQCIQIQIEQHNQQIKLDLQNQPRSYLKPNKAQTVQKQTIESRKQDQIKEIQIIDLLDSSLEKQPEQVKQKQAHHDKKTVAQQNQGLIIYKLLDEEIMQIILTHPRPQSRFQTDSESENDKKNSQLEEISIQRITYYMNKKYSKDQRPSVQSNKQNSQMHSSNSFTQELILSRVCFLFTCVKEYVNLVISSFISQKQRTAENQQKKHKTTKKYDCNEILFQAFQQKVLHVFLRSQDTDTQKKDSNNAKNPNFQKQYSEKVSPVEYNVEEIQQKIQKMNESMRRLIFQQGIKKIFEQQLTNCYKRYMSTGKTNRGKFKKNKDKSIKLPRIIVSPLHKELLKIYMKFYKDQKQVEKGQQKKQAIKQNDTDFCQLIPFLMDVVDEILHGKKRKKVSKNGQNRIQRQGNKSNQQQGDQAQPKQKKKCRSRKVKEKITNVNPMIYQPYRENEKNEQRQKQRQELIDQEGANQQFYFGVQEEFKLEAKQMEKMDNENCVSSRNQIPGQYMVEEIYKDLFMQNDHKAIYQDQGNQPKQKIIEKIQKEGHQNALLQGNETSHNQNIDILTEYQLQSKQIHSGDHQITNQNKFTQQVLQTTPKVYDNQEEKISEEDFMSGDQDTPVNILKIFDDDLDSNNNQNQNLSIHQLLDISAIRKADDDDQISDHFQIGPHIDHPNLLKPTQQHLNNEANLSKTQVDQAILPEKTQNINDPAQRLNQTQKQNKNRQLVSAFSQYIQLEKCIYDSNLSQSNYDHAQNIKTSENFNIQSQQFYPVSQKYEKKKPIKRERTQKAGNNKAKAERKQRIENRKLIVIKVKQKNSNMGIEDKQSEIKSKINKFNRNQNLQKSKKVPSRNEKQKEPITKRRTLRTERKAKKLIEEDSDEDRQALQILTKKCRKKQVQDRRMKQIERQEKLVLKKFVKYNKEEAEQIIREYEAMKGQVEQRKNFGPTSLDRKNSVQNTQKQIDEYEDYIQEGQLDQQDEENLFYNDFADQNFKKQDLDETQQPNRNEEVEHNSESNQYATHQKYENEYEINFDTEKQIEKHVYGDGFKGRILEQALDNGQLEDDLDEDYENVEFQHQLSGNDVQRALDEADVNNQLEDQSDGSSQYEIIG